jgi:spermidine/putrescine transport system substrate-binding protein
MANTGAIVTRRQALQLGASGIAAMSLGGLLSACGSADSRVKFFNWQDYIDPKLLADFTAATKIDVSYSTYASNDELGDRLALAGVPRRGNRKATSFDVIVPSDSLFRRLRDQDRVQALDSKIVTETLLSNIDPVFRALELDPGNRFTVPWATGSTGIGYDTTVFGEPPDWSVFLDATHAGKLTLLDEKREAFAAAMYSLGLDPNSTNQADIDAAGAQLQKMKANTAFDSETYLAKLTAGETVAAQAFSTDALQAQARNPKLAFVIPDAGGSRWIDLLCIPSDAPNAEGANKLIAYYLDGKVSAQNAVAIKANTANNAALAFIPVDMASDPMINPVPDVRARLNFLIDLGDVEDKYNTVWQKVRG